MSRPRIAVGEFSVIRRSPCGCLAATSVPELFADRSVHPGRQADSSSARRNSPMNGIIYLIGLIVVIMAILSFLGLR
jgi:hypothetical protein